MGYEVTVFEALHTAGGVLMYGIPEFRLPKAIVQKEIDTLKDLGVEFVLNFVVGRSETIDELFGGLPRGYLCRSVAGLLTFIGAPARTQTAFTSANEYLTRINLMKAYKENADTLIPPRKSRCCRRRQRSYGRCSLQTAHGRRGSLHRIPPFREGASGSSEEIHHAKEEGVVSSS